MRVGREALPLDVQEGRPDCQPKLSERLKEWAVETPRTLMQTYLEGASDCHVHFGVVGDELDLCAVFVGPVGARRPGEGLGGLNSDSDDDVGEIDCTNRDVSVFVSYVEPVEDVKRVGFVSRLPW